MKLLTLLVLAIASRFVAAEAMSWNLSRDLAQGMRTNPSGAWAFLTDLGGTGLSANFTRLAFREIQDHGPGKIVVWRPRLTGGGVGIGVPLSTFVVAGSSDFTKGLPVVHPSAWPDDTANVPAIIRWRSPISGTVDILGKVQSFHDGCGGDGISWALRKGGTVLSSGTFGNGGSDAFSATSIPVLPGNFLYFMVYAGGSNSCDWTNVDLLIVGKT